MTSFRFTVKRPDGAEDRDLQLVFRATRSQVRTVRVDGRVPRSITAHGRRFRFSAPAGGWGTVLGLSAEYDGEPASLREVLWLEPGEAQAEPVGPAPATGLEARLLGAQQQLGAVDLTSPDAVLAATGNRDAIDYGKAFFFALDRATHPGLEDRHDPWPKERLKQLQQVKPLLQSRLRRRWASMQAFVAGPQGGFDPRTGNSGAPLAAIAAAVPAVADLVPDAQATLAVSTLMLALFRQWYPGNTAGLDRAQVRTAMERFAAGRLGPCAFDAMHDTWSAQPDSANLFLFAEFAFLALDQKLEPEAWTVLARIFTGIEPIYGRAYAHHGVGCTPAGPEKQGLRLSWRMLGPPVVDAKVLDDAPWLAALRAAHDGDAHPLRFRHAAHVWHICPAGIETDL